MSPITKADKTPSYMVQESTETIMAETEHPRYPHSVVLEALAEVFFTLPSDKPWQPSFFGEFIKRVQPEFPTIEPVIDVGIRIGIGPGGTDQALPLQRFRFHHATKPLVLQLSNISFSIHRLPPYPGWEVVCEDVNVAWKHFVDVLQPDTISRVNLRYINRIPFTEAMQRPSHWLNANEFLAPAVLESEPAFFSRVESRFDASNVCIVMLGYIPPDENVPDAPFGAMLFDIDRVSEREISPEKENLLDEVNNLHKDVWNVFSSAKTASLERLMKGR